MKYGETIFDIAYLVTALVFGILILKKAKTKAHRQMGRAALILGAGDAFHLIPRIIGYFTASDLTAALGIGKLITSLTMTLFYVYVYYICFNTVGKKADGRLTAFMYILVCARFILCAFPQNGWLTNKSDMLWGIIRNIPFMLLGILTIVLYVKYRRDLGCLKNAWLYITLSFLFYMPVAVFAGVLPILGMLMLPKTVCYVLLLAAFYRQTAS